MEETTQPICATLSSDRSTYKRTTASAALSRGVPFAKRIWFDPIALLDPTAGGRAPMRSKRDPDDRSDSGDSDTGPSFYERAIRTSIGRGLRRYYDLSEPIPDRMAELLRKLDQQPEPATAEQKTDTAKDPGTE
jgi:hypothetical protein